MAKTKSFQLQFTKKQLFFSVTALLFCFLLTFALGALIGIRYFGNSSDPLITSSVKEQTDTSPGTYGALESHTVPDSEGEKVVHEFTFYDTLPEKAETPMPQAPARQEEKKSTTETKIKKTDKLSPSSTESPQLKYTIQFGSFKEEEKAHALSNKLNKQGLLAYVSATKIPNRGTFYRVRMGSFDTQEEAKEWASKLPPLSPSPFITSIK
jgi:cell division septation protein DedD